MVAGAVASKSFTVLVDMNFKIGSAILGTDTLIGRVNALESAADNAVNSLARIGLGFASSLGIGPGGVLGLVGGMVSASESFRDSQLGISQVISANVDKFTGASKTFEGRMGASRTILRDIAKDAKKFGLDEKSLFNQTKIVGNMLAQKELTGTNLDVPRNLARNILKASPSLGLHPADIEGQLFRAIEGRASGGDTMFNRLVADTDVMAKMTTKAFNAKPIQQRLGLISSAFEQFTSDGKILEHRALSIGAQFTILKNRLFGFDGILLPIGHKFREIIVKILVQINALVDKHGEKLVDNFMRIINRINFSLTALAENLLFFRNFGRTITQTRSALTGLGTSLFFLEIAAGGTRRAAIYALGKGNLALAGTFLKIGKAAKFLNAPVAIFVGLMNILGAVFQGINNPVAEFITKWSRIAGTIVSVLGIIGIVLAAFGKLGVVLSAIGTLFTTIFLPMLLFVGVFALINKAIAIARVEDAKKIPELLVKLSDLGAKAIEALDLITQPFFLTFDFLARLIAPLFGMDATINPIINLISLLVDGLHVLGMAFLRIGSTVAGLGATIGQFAFNIRNFTFRDFLDDRSGKAFSGMGDAFDESYNDFFAKGLKHAADERDKDGIVKQTVNINGGVNITNQFKENQEPDRVAFTIKDQILRAAAAPLTANGGAFSAAARIGGT